MCSLLSLLSLNLKLWVWTMWNTNLAVGCVSCHWVVWKFLHWRLEAALTFTIFCIWEMRWVGEEEKKKGLDTLIPSPHSCFGSWEACLKDVCVCKYRQPQPKPHCLGSDLCSDKLEHILLSKDVILLLTVIFSVGLLGGSLCDVTQRLPRVTLRKGHSHSKKSVTQMTCAFIWFLW